MLLISNQKQRKSLIVYYLLVSFVLSGALCLSVLAKSITLDWDVGEAADYYIVYWGPTAENPTENSGDIGAQTSYTLTIPDTGNYYFAVKAFNNCGNSSDFSDWINLGDILVPSVPIPPDPLPSVPIPPDPSTPDPLPIPPVEPDSTIDDNLTQQTLKSVITDGDNYPSIEVFTKKFEHLEWLMTGWPDYNDISGVAHVATGDISNNGENEILIGLAQVYAEDYIPGGYFEVVGKDYSHLAWGRVQWPEYNLSNGETWPTCGDIDGDGIDEIIVGLGVGGQGYFEIFKYTDGKVVHFAWGHVEWNEYNSLVGETRPVCADIDGDGFDEIIVGLGSKGGNSETPGGRFEIFDNDLTHISWCTVDWLEYNSINGETWPAPGDINGDGNIEIIVGLGVGGDGKMALFDYSVDGNIQSEWVSVEWNEYNQVSGETRPVCGDIDNDMKDEIIVGFGPVGEDVEMPEGFFTVIDDDLTMLDWGQITNSEFNKLNGESIPSKGKMANDDIIIIGLGSWDFKKENDESTNSLINASAPDGCFISATY